MFVPVCDRPSVAEPMETQAAKNPQGNTTKRVKGVEDLNICIIGAQGIVGVGATIRMCT
jgi:hypothetical protein